MYELIVDNFAGGGGASTGIEIAIGRSVDIAINHDPEAIAMHKVNHPSTEHYCENVWDVDPVKACKGRPVGLAWFSPDCKHFSKAKGSKPVDKNIRGLAWIVLKWAGKVRPRVIILENVEEFITWGPVRKGKPVKSKKGQTFQQWKSQLEALGYETDYRELRACDYGAPTSRKRLFVIARCDGQPIVWPEPTHGDPKSEADKSGKLKPWRTAAEIIDWSLPCPSIFERKRPLAEATMRRIARGIQKFVIENPDPFIVRIGQTGFAGDGLQYHSYDDSVRGQDLTRPLLTQDTSIIGQDLREPLHTITTSPGHFAEVRAFLIKYYGQGTGQTLTEPLDTVVSKDRFGLVTIASQDYQIVDIGMRMLEPRELYNAQGFPEDYIIEFDVDGKRYSKKAQVARCGNAVPPPFAEALVRANLPELCQRKEQRLA